MVRKEFLVYFLSTLFAVALVLLSNMKTTHDMELSIEKNNVLVLTTVKEQVELEKQKIFLENRRKWVEKLADACAECLSQLQLMSIINGELLDARKKKVVSADDLQILKATVLARHERSFSAWKSIYRVMGLLNLKDDTHKELYIMLLKMHSDLRTERNAAIDGTIENVASTFNVKIYKTMQEIINAERRLILGQDSDLLSGEFFCKLTPTPKKD